MSDEYRQWERRCETIRKENATLLEEFGMWLSAQGIGAKSIKEHLGNVEFYINEYLLYDDATRAADGWGGIDSFLGYWFIRKAMWASQASIRRTAASLKKFYAFMHEKGLVGKEGLEEVRETIKCNMSDWLATVRRYDDPSITDSEEIWGLK
ncbi:MAG: recombinase [Candidatus Eisenbacteria bacterium]|nr:recombinase [Candidatus Eisenbacteria bacterium]